MIDIHHKSPDTRQHRWWRIPPITQKYKKGWNRIFRKKKATAPKNPKKGTNNDRRH
jgi:hypothetical protein|tara:strand:+ start:101 stop:268 length:168 start_codon:yes stop_codon:yes gene_type:complete